MLAKQEQSEITAALSLLDSALVLSPGNDSVIELKARSLLYLRRFKEVADMLQDYIPSVMTSFDDISSSSSSSSSDNLQHFSKEGVRLLLSGESPSREEPKCKCFSVSDLKKVVLAKLGKKGESEGQWRYLVLGQACCHLVDVGNFLRFKSCVLYTELENPQKPLINVEVVAHVTRPEKRVSERFSTGQRFPWFLDSALMIGIILHVIIIKMVAGKYKRRDAWMEILQFSLNLCGRAEF